MARKKVAVEEEKPKNAEEKVKAEEKPKRKVKAEEKKNKEAKVKEPKKRERSKKQEIPVVEAEVVKGNKGTKNLQPLTKRSPEEARKIRALGGKAAAKARHEKKELRDFTKSFLMQNAATVLQQNMKTLGVEEEDRTNLAAMVVRLFSKAVNNGDLNAARTLIEWAGMAPLQQERENEAIAKMAQVMELASAEANSQDDSDDVVFYIPDNQRPVVSD